MYQSNRWWNDWRFQFHCNELEWVDPKSTPKRFKPFSVSSKKLYISKTDRTARFVGPSKLKELDINDFYERKQTNKEMEAEMTKMDLTPDHLAEEENEDVDEAIPTHINFSISH